MASAAERGPAGPKRHKRSYDEQFEVAVKAEPSEQSEVVVKSEPQTREKKQRTDEIGGGNERSSNASLGGTDDAGHSHGSKLERIIARLQKDTDELKVETARLQKENAGLKRKTAELERKIENLDWEVSALQREPGELEYEIAKLKKEAARLKKRKKRNEDTTPDGVASLGDNAVASGSAVVPAKARDTSAVLDDGVEAGHSPEERLSGRISRLTSSSSVSSQPLPPFKIRSTLSTPTSSEIRAAEAYTSSSDGISVPELGSQLSTPQLDFDELCCCGYRLSGDDSL